MDTLGGEGLKIKTFSAVSQLCIVLKAALHYGFWEDADNLAMLIVFFFFGPRVFPMYAVSVAHRVSTLY